jgi:hypothetical protein
LTDEGSVIYSAERNHCRRVSDPTSADLHSGPRRNFQVFNVRVFLAELTLHIADKGEHLVHYYGLYCLARGHLVNIRHCRSSATKYLLPKTHREFRCIQIGCFSFRPHWLVLTTR